MFALTTILLSCLLFQVTWGNVIVYDQGFTFHLETQDDCDQGLTLLVSESGNENSLPICNNITENQLTEICGKVATCGGNRGVITNLTNPSKYPLMATNSSLTFWSDVECSTKVLCYDNTAECALPRISNGKYRDSAIALYTLHKLEAGARVELDCHDGYTWDNADFVTCIKTSTGVSRLSSEPRCRPLSRNNLMTLRVNVSLTAHVSLMSGIDVSLLTPEKLDQIISSNTTGGVTCLGNVCSIPNTFPQESTSEDHVAALLGEYTSCFGTSIISLFLSGIRSYPGKDLFKKYDVRPITKRELVSNNLQVRIDKLDIVYNQADRIIEGIEVRFYMFHYHEVISPSVTTKILAQVPREKYDVVLESYCRLVNCASDDYSKCTDIPSMQFHSIPQPTMPCRYKGKSLSYGEPVPLQCSHNEYNNEENITLCLFSNQYSPEVLPQCTACGGMVYSDWFQGPSRFNGLNSRGSHCIWEVDTKHNNKGQFYQIAKGSLMSCSNPVNYLKVTTISADGTIINEFTDICYGVIMKLGNRFRVEFKSNAASEIDKSFTFVYEPDLPPQPWYKRYMTIIVAAPLIVLFFVSLVFLGVYCDHRNKRERDRVKSLVVQLEQGHNDQVSNGTWRPNESIIKQVIDESIEDEAISPQPRVHNAVTREGKRKKKRTVSPNKQSISPDGRALAPGPVHDSWVLSNNSAPSSTFLTSTPEQEEVIRPEQEGSQVFNSPVARSRLRVDPSEPLTTTTPSDISPSKPRKKKRRRRRIPTDPNMDPSAAEPGNRAASETARPLPAFDNGGTISVSRGRALPSLGTDGGSTGKGDRALPPITGPPGNANGVPRVHDLAVD